MMTAKQSKELKKLCDPKRIVNELKSHLNLCSGCDIIDKVKILEKENDEFKIAMIKHTQQNYDEWKKETESDAIKLIRLDLVRVEEENKDLKLRAPYSVEYYDNIIGELQEEIKKLEITDKTCLNICELIEDKLPTNYQHEDIIKYIKELKEEIEKLQEGNKKRFDKIKGLEYELKQEKEKKPDEPIVIKDSDIKRANKNLSKQLETEKDKVNQVLTSLECWKEENKKLKEEIKHKNQKFGEWCEENKELKEQIDKLEEQEELKSIGKDDENGNYQDIIEDLENANKELQGEIKTSNDINIKLKDDNVKLIDEIECMKSHSDMSEEEYEGELKDKEAIVNYLTDELDKFKKLFDESKKENQKAKDIKGIVVNEDKTIITINGVELNIGDVFNVGDEVGMFELKEIYVGKSGKYSLRTDSKTIRIGNKYIVGKVKIERVSV